ncbi:phosphatidylglycerophosphatase A [Paenibacillus validus]|uniref:Phosphatidylglycerophosphatase A n=1 Tax=Paenibacillus validus TaxID=44253 RepID=A0A7X3CUZ3_9BACL|nr:MULTISPECIES: phosphatidylglycerophosphatase A [Paenibacillus]MED4600177.1 phosphatidylglycerophosphatase A [Paenibacillus validus]MED4607651.1 phosphatidylglycerophosphatase A [Paenibacillus validus]MUG72657.1 phosphatidylglycerophosphatase A [Paenibacillus validus]
MNRQVHSKEVKAAVYRKLQERGVTIEDIALIVREMQLPYNAALTIDQCVEAVHAVLQKRELQHAILVGIELDVLAEKGLLSEPIQSIIASDEGLFGCDETLALGSVFGYGSIAVTTFGHLDKQKIGIIKQLDTKNGRGVHTFLDDLVASIASSAASRIAHHQRDQQEREEQDNVVVPIVPDLETPEKNAG